MADQIELLIHEAHSLFGETSVFEVIDLPTRQEAAKWLVEYYGSAADEGKVDLYLSILDRLRQEIEKDARSAN